MERCEVSCWAEDDGYGLLVTHVLVFNRTSTLSWSTRRTKDAATLLSSGVTIWMDLPGNEWSDRESTMVDLQEESNAESNASHMQAGRCMPADWD
ncbi:hypothetical protein ColTof4_12983 [Colletotrichum tofieldiae]|nr:hypothetical protein ColTof3_00381 [Colletotrichum tofieldiae]GKT80560.1 hypothetical protein ColTof4_12983 [Colletotrichum tofieldiae]GKT88682.1 hypothetical protein Ct61P_06532 [Colletotrichum tofieldiae]